MNSVSRRNPKPERQSLFFHDLASPVSGHRSGSRFNTPGQATTVSALWHENFGGSDPPPPPVFTLEDRIDFSPEPTIGELPASPELRSGSRTPKPSRGYLSSPSHGTRADASNSVLVNGGLIYAKHHQQSPESANWWSPVNKGETEHIENGRGSPVDGVVHSGALIILPPQRESVRPDMQINNLPMGTLDEEEWVTVYGFSAGDTNLVLREFEKCGIILRHVLGPRVANWMHILYQNRYDAQRALGKNGTQINGVLIIGVKPLDYAQRQYLDARLDDNNHASFSAPSFTPRTTFRRSSSASISPGGVGIAAARTTNHLNDYKEHRSMGAIASPAKSVASKIMDLMFGI